MSIFNELLPKIKKIPNVFIKSFNDELKVALESLDKFEEEFLKGNIKSRDKTQREKHATTLESIHEGDDETPKSNGDSQHTDNSKTVTEITSKTSMESNPDQPRRTSKKRNKNEVDDVFSPEQDKRLKRNASVKAQSIISKQVNVNLTQKLRRENSTDKTEKPQSSRSRRRKDDDKENTLPVQIKEEKISLPPENDLMELETASLIIPVKQEADWDDIAMPPPAVPLPKSRKPAAKEKSKEDESSEDEGAKRRTTRTRKQTDNAPIQAARSTRGSARGNVPENEDPAPTEARPKRTRAKKKPNDPVNDDVEKDTQSSVLSGVESSAEKPRPKRTRKIQKATYVENDSEKDEPKETQEPIISPKDEIISEPEIKSPILPLKQKYKESEKRPKEMQMEKETERMKEMERQKEMEKEAERQKEIEKEAERKKEMEKETARQKEKDILNETHVIKEATAIEMDKTMVLPNGHVAVQKTMNLNETVVIETRPIMDATVVLDNVNLKANITEDNSLMTDDSDIPNSPRTPPLKQPPVVQPTSAVKEKVQQFEELASRTTRTKTRAMAKKEDPVENQTPPDKILKVVLSADTLHKMNDMIFNGKPPQHQTTSSAAKPRAAVPVPMPVKSTASASKLTALRAARDAEERDKEDARRKKEAMLEAKRELQRKKREEKMAAAAAARDAAERERKAAYDAAATERDRRQAQLDCGRQDRLRDIERKKLELARKVAETEERRRAEELARRQRLATEQRKADELRKRQITEAENVRKEEALMKKEIEKKQKEYMEKQKMKSRIEDKMHTPLKCSGATGVPISGSSTVEPVYMCDGFQYLNSDEDSDPPEMPPLDWSTAKARRVQLSIQTSVSSIHVDRLFSVRVHSPDLRQIFPNIERTRLKRTSSAVWRTPPARLPALHE